MNKYLKKYLYIFFDFIYLNFRYYTQLIIIYFKAELCNLMIVEFKIYI
jgi:hypothetical protein